jgi:hypothetical protein
MLYDADIEIDQPLVGIMMLKRTKIDGVMALGSCAYLGIADQPRKDSTIRYLASDDSLDC